MNFAPMTINLFAIKVNLNERGSTINFGPYQQADQFITSKRNQGIEDNGDLCVYNSPIMNIYDADVLDSNSTKGSIV
ncbi:hypothetical protein MO973_05350 [Paenibacillus sp. TRM 82003]|nr:hypothetical protein [Paenibacillus sp. TRM 82003]